MRIDTEAGEGEFAHIGPPDADHAGAAEVRDHRCVGGGRRPFSQNDGTCGRDAAGKIEEVLPGDGQAVEQPEGAAGLDARGGSLRFARRTLLRERDEDRSVGVVFDPRQGFRDKRDGIELAGLHENGEARKCSLVDHGTFSGWRSSARIRFSFP